MQRICDVAGVKEHESADDGIEIIREHSRAAIAFDERHIGSLLFSSALTRLRKHRGIHIDPDHASRFAHDIGGLKRHVTWSTAKIEHLHAGSDPGVKKKPRHY